MKRPILKKGIQVLLFVSLGLVILFLVYNNQQAAYQEYCDEKGIPAGDCDLVAKVLTDFSEAHFIWIGVVFLLFIISNLSRTMRWYMLMEPLGKKINLLTGFLSIMLGYFANLGFPRIGEVIRAGSLARYENERIERVMGTVAVDRMVDMVTLILIMGLALLVEYDRIAGFLAEKASIDIGANIYIITATVIILILAGFWLIYKNRARLEDRKAFGIIFRVLRGFRDGIISIKKVRRPFWFVFHSLVIWIAFFLMVYIGFWVYDPTSALGLDAAITVFVFGALGFVIPTPGGMGSYHYLVIQALAIYGIAGFNAFSFANIMFFSVQIGCNITLGIAALILLPLLHNRRELKNANNVQSEG